ncbi:MAG: type II toxin-antitoxin system HicB family antitoxin [Gemmatimonadota bacterium]
MEGRQLLKQLKDDAWYLGDTAGACRQYVHGKRPGVITVCVRHTQSLGPETSERATTPAEHDPGVEPSVALEPTGTGVSAYSPELPGCVATGENEAEARERMAEALALHRAALKATPER